MADTFLVDAAVIGVLANDAELTALCPGGVYWGLAPAGLTAFVIVSRADASEVPALDSQTMYERTTYLVRASVLTSGGTVTRQAAARIHELLQHASLDLSAAGYEPMVCRRLEAISLPPEIDPAEKSARWQHRGGLYELLSYPIE